MIDFKRRTEFLQNLTTLINQHGIDNDVNTPDFILAEYVLGCLSIYENTVKKTAQHAGLVVRNQFNG